MRYLIAAYWAIIVAGLTFFVFQSLSDLYIKSLKASGELVMAQDVLSAQMAPYLLAVMFGAGVFKFVSDK